MSDHTNARLKVIGSQIETEAGESIAYLRHPFPFATDDKERDANGRRLVACWNACEGLTLETIERAFKDNEDYFTIKRLRDELIEAVRDAIECPVKSCTEPSKFGTISWTAIDETKVSRLRALVAPKETANV